MLKGNVAHNLLTFKFMKAKFDYSFPAKDKEGNPVLLRDKQGNLVYDKDGNTIQVVKAYYSLSGSPAEINNYVEWRTSQGWQVRRKEDGTVQMVGRMPLNTDTSGKVLYDVKSGELGGQFTYWIDHSSTRNSINSVNTAASYGNAAFTAEFTRQTVSDVRGTSISSQALDLVKSAAQGNPANLQDPIADSE